MNLVQSLNGDLGANVFEITLGVTLEITRHGDPQSLLATFQPVFVDDSSNRPAFSHASTVAWNGSKE
jgi:hypothetical protein